MRYFHFWPITSVKTAKDGEQAPACFHTHSCDRHKETNSSSDSDMFLSIHSFHISSPILVAGVLQLCYISVRLQQISTSLEISEPAARL